MLVRDIDSATSYFVLCHNDAVAAWSFCKDTNNVSWFPHYLMSQNCPYVKWYWKVPGLYLLCSTNMRGTLKVITPSLLVQKLGIILSTCAQFVCAILWPCVNNLYTSWQIWTTCLHQIIYHLQFIQKFLHFKCFLCCKTKNRWSTVWCVGWLPKFLKTSNVSWDGPLSFKKENLCAISVAIFLSVQSLIGTPS